MSQEPSAFLVADRHPHIERAAAMSEVEQLRARVRSLERLCTAVYAAAVDLGLPQPLLNALWTVAGNGNAPRAFAVDVPPRRSARPVVERVEAPAPPTIHPRLVPRPDPHAVRKHPAQQTLQPLPVRRRVLVVDDDAMMLQVLHRILERDNYELLVASSGEEAVELVRHYHGRIDLLITDYAMPGMNGRRLAQHLREMVGPLPVLYQTGFSDMLFEDRRQLEDRAAFLEKPFTARGLLEAARFSLFGTLNPTAGA